MGRIKTTAELFEEEEKKGWEQRKKGVSLIKPISPVGELTLEKTEEVKIPEKPKGLLDVLNEDIEKNYTEYLKLQKNLTEFDTTLEGIPDSIKPSVIANYNKVVNKFNSLIGTLQTDIAKRDEIYSVQKKQDFVHKKQLGIYQPQPDVKSQPQESGLKDIWDAFRLGSSGMIQKSKQYFNSALPNAIFAPIKKNEMGKINLTDEQVEKVNIGNEKKREAYKSKYQQAETNYSMWLQKNPELKPRPEWEKGVIETVKANPKVLLNPAYWGYVAAQSAAFTLGVIGTTLATTAITGNPLIGMASGVLIATPMQSQDLYEDLVANGATEEQAANLSIPIGGLIATVEVMGDLPILASVSAPFKKMLFGNINKTVAKATTGLLAKGIKTFATIEASETLEEVVQGAIQDATVKTVNENRNMLANIPETVIQTLMATVPFAIVGLGSEVQITEQLKKKVTDINYLNALRIQLEDLGFVPKTEMEAFAYKVEEEIKKETTPKAKPKPLGSFKEKVYRGVYRGTGKTQKAWGIFGKGTYYTFDKEYASRFGEVEEVELELKNPYRGTTHDVISLSDEARMEANKRGLDGDEIEEIAEQAITDTLKSQGYDGIIVTDQEHAIISFADSTTQAKPTEKVKPKPLTKEEIYAEKYGIPLEKVNITELPKADVTSEFVSEETINKLEELVGKETTPKEVLKKVEEKIALKEELKAEGKEPIIPEITENIISKIEQTFDEEAKPKAFKTPEPIFIRNNILKKVTYIINKEILKAKEKEPSIVIPKEEILSKVDSIIREGFPKGKVKEVNIPAIKEEIISKVNKVLEEAIPKVETPKAISKELKPLAEEAREAKDVDEFVKNISKPTRPIREARVGELVTIQSDTYGEKTSDQYNMGVPTQGEIVKINPKSVSVQVGENVYKFPESAKVSTLDLQGFKGKTKQDITDFYNQVTEQKAVVEKVGEKVGEKVAPAKQEEEPTEPVAEETISEEEEPEFDKEVMIKDLNMDFFARYAMGEKAPSKKVKLADSVDKVFDLILKGENKAAKEAFKEGKKEGIFKQKEKFEDLVNRAKERKAQKKYVNKLIKDINNLPTQNISVDYRDKIEAIKETFDLKKRQQKTLHAREETAKFIEKEIKEGNTNLRIPQEVIDTLKKTPLNDMTITQLEDVHDTILQLAHIGKTKGKMIKIQKGRRTEELVQDLINALNQGKEIPTGKRNIRQELKELGSLKKQVKDILGHYWINSTLDETLFEIIDGRKRGLWCATFYDVINKCVNDELIAGFKRIEDSQNNIADNKIDIVKHLQERSGDLMLTSSQRVGVYLASLDEDARRHIQNKGFPIVKDKEPYKFTDKDLEDIANNLTKEEKARVKHYQEYQINQGNELDEFDVRVRGVHLKKVKNRYGIQIQNEDLDNSKAIEIERNPTTRRAYIEQDFRQPRTHRAENIINIDSESNMLRDIAKVEHYKAYEEAVIDINNLLTNEELKRAIINNPRYGRIAYDNIMQWFKDSVKAKQNKILSTSDKVLMFLRTSAFMSMLGINVISGTKQLVSLCNAVAETNLTTILSGIEQVALHYNETKQFAFQRDPQMRARKGQIDKIMREWMDTTDAKQILTGKTKDIRMKTLFLIRSLDEFAVLSVWKGTYDQAISQGKTEEEAIKRAGEVMRKTQPQALTKDLPQWFRDGTAVNLFNLFQNQINKNQNYIRHDMFGKLKAGQISPGTFAHRVLWGWILPAVLIGTITRGRLPKDWEEFAKLSCKDMAVYLIGGWFFVGSLVVNIMEGYGGWIPAPLTFGDEFAKAVTYKKWEDKFRYGISGICKVIGLPYNQPYRTIDGVDDWLKGETDDIRRLIWSEYVLGKEEKKELVKGKPKKPSKPSRPSKPTKPKKP